MFYYVKANLSIQMLCFFDKLYCQPRKLYSFLLRFSPVHSFLIGKVLTQSFNSTSVVSFYSSISLFLQIPPGFLSLLLADGSRICIRFSFLSPFLSSFYLSHRAYASKTYHPFTFLFVSRIISHHMWLFSALFSRSLLLFLQKSNILLRLTLAATFRCTKADKMLDSCPGIVYSFRVLLFRVMESKDSVKSRQPL